VSYLAVYTPLKTVTPYHTVAGAFSGATPPLLGFAAAQDAIGENGWILFALMFAWQVPHFLSIEMMYREDYAKGGIRVLPLEADGEARTRRSVVGWTVLVVCASLAPAATGLERPLYMVPAAVLGTILLATGLRVVRRSRRLRPGMLLKATIAYLPLIMALMLVFER
jgi:protoheme IX farnesyltransferase